MKYFMWKKEDEGQTTLRLYEEEAILTVAGEPLEEVMLHHGQSGRLYLETQDGEQTVLTPIPTDEEVRYGPAIDDQGYIGLGRGTLLYRGPASMAAALFKAVMKQLTA